MRPERSRPAIDDANGVVSLDEYRRRRLLAEYEARRARHDRERLGLEPWPTYKPARVVMAEALRDLGRAIADGLAEIGRAFLSLFRRRRP